MGVIGFANVDKTDFAFSLFLSPPPAFTFSFAFSAISGSSFKASSVNQRVPHQRHRGDFIGHLMSEDQIVAAARDENGPRSHHFACNADPVGHLLEVSLPNVELLPCGKNSVRRAKACIFSGFESRPATVVPAGSSRSDDGGNEIVEASDATGRFWRLSERAGRNVSER
jgi:hypothetical protein